MRAYVFFHRTEADATDAKVTAARSALEYSPRVRGTNTEYNAHARGLRVFIFISRKTQTHTVLLN